MDENCVICNKPLKTEDVVPVREKGVASLINASRQRQDGLENSFRVGLLVHIKCRKEYTRQSSILKSAKRPREPFERNDDHSDTPSLRSAAIPFDFKIHCLFCGEIASKEEEAKKRVERRVQISRVETKEMHNLLTRDALKRNDEWGQIVLTRLNTAHDLIAAEARYHDSCSARFRTGKNPPQTPAGLKKRGRPRLAEDLAEFRSLCDFLEDSDDSQFSLDELLEKINGEEEHTYTKRWLKDNLLAYFGDRISVVELPGKPTLISIKEYSGKVLYQQWYSEKKQNADDERIRIVETAAKILREDIRSKVFDTDVYPGASNLSSDGSELPSSLQAFLETLISSKSKSDKGKQRKRSAIGQAIVKACRPRSSIPPILLGVGLWVHRHFATRQLIDLLHNLGFSESYQEVKKFETCLAEQTDSGEARENFFQAIFDNADFNIRTIDGFGTFHSLGGLLCTTPPENRERPPVSRLLKVPSADQIAAKGRVDIKFYRKPRHLGLDLVTVEELQMPSELSALQARAFDMMWVVGKSTSTSISPSWNGYWKKGLDDLKICDVSQIDAFPFINLDPGNLNTLYTAMLLALDVSRKSGQEKCFVTFDQPLYIKSVEMVASADDGSALKNVVVRLGGFHLLMSFMGAIGSVMDGSGLEDLWNEVYAKASVKHMLTGHAYARALRAHFLTQESLFQLLFPALQSAFPAETSEVAKLHSQFLRGEASPKDITDSRALAIISDAFAETCKDLATKSRTAALWMEYIEQVHTIRMFIRAERTADWDLHLHSVKKMLPFLHAAGHLNYAKCAHLYLQTMLNLKETLPAAEYENFVTKGYFAVRRSEKYWSGIWTDMIIEQELMRGIKTSGGLTRGRGITESTLAHWVLTLPGTISMCEAVEEMAGVSSASTEQHVELRDSRQQRDHRDVQKFLSWLKEHNPFDPQVEGLISISSGALAHESVNCDQAVAVGEACMSKMIGQKFGKLKLRRLDKVKTLSYSGATVKIRGDVVPVATDLLFMRIAHVMKTEDDLKMYLSYELAPYPPALFKDDGMRKTDKSALCDFFPFENATDEDLNNLLSPERERVIDGGMLLRRVVWPRPSTYNDIFQSYIRYTATHYGKSPTIVFDGYSAGPSTKEQEQVRRAGKRTCANILVDGTKMVTCSQADFLSNSFNKKKLVEQLKIQFEMKGVRVIEADGDADEVIVAVALQKSSAGSEVTVVASDTDILVMLIARATKNISLLMPGVGSQPEKIYDIEKVQNQVGVMKDHALFAHAVSGCDTTSAIFNKGKKKSWTLLKNSEKLRQKVSIFSDADADGNEIAKAGELFLIELYNGRNWKSLDELRIFVYCRGVAKINVTATFNLANLPPTSAAARHHSFRVYCQVQQWLGRNVDPLKWGWKHVDGKLVPETTLLPPAPDELLHIISCNCKGTCESTARCECRRAGLHCSSVCVRCRDSCQNAPNVETSDEEGVDDPDEGVRPQRDFKVLVFKDGQILTIHCPSTECGVKPTPSRKPPLVIDDGMQ